MSTSTTTIHVIYAPHRGIDLDLGVFATVEAAQDTADALNEPVAQRINAERASAHKMEMDRYRDEAALHAARRRRTAPVKPVKRPAMTVADLRHHGEGYSVESYPVTG